MSIPFPRSLLWSPHHSFGVNALVELSDGSFVSCSDDGVVKRWLLSMTIVTTDTTSDKASRLQEVSSFVGDYDSVSCGVEKDKNTLITGGRGSNSLKVWNISNCQCVNSIDVGKTVWCLTITKDLTKLMCGLGDGRVETRSLSDFVLIPHSDRSIQSRTRKRVSRQLNQSVGTVGVETQSTETLCSRPVPESKFCLSTLSIG